MKFSFRKIGSILASGAMLSSTVALAAAANFPVPYVTNSGADVAIVHGGADAAFTDLVAVADITSFLSSRLAEKTAKGGATTKDDITGEAYELFTTGSPLLMNSTLATVRSTISDSHLPTVLKDGILETTTNVDFTQRINLGSTPRLEFKQQPSSSDDPQFGFSLSTTPGTGYIYNASITFESNVNLTHADSVGEELALFGTTFTIGGATSATKLVLLKTAETIGLSSDVNPSESVTVEDKEYTIDLVASTDSSATIKVTDDTGKSDEKEISEANSKTIRGLEVTLDTADENNFRLTATISVGSSRMTFQDGATVKLGTEDKAIEGTQVEFYLTNDTAGTPANLGKIIVQITTDNSDEDAIFPGGAFVDPVFGSFKIDFTGVSVPVDSLGDREDIVVKNSGNDKMTVAFEAHDADAVKTVNWVINNSKSQISQSGQDLAANSDGDRIVVAEMGAVNKSEFVVIASDKEGGLYEVTEIANGSTGFADDYVTMKNVFSGDEKTFKATSEGSITGVTLQGKTYTITYFGASTIAQEARQIRVNQGESAGQGMILFPSIVTSKGAKVAFYEPTSVKIDAWDNNSAYTNATSFEIQDGDNYGSITIGAGTGGAPNAVGGNYTFTFPGGSVQIVNTSAANSSADGLIGKLRFNITSQGPSGGGVDSNNSVDIFLVSPAGTNIIRPALIIFEEKDDASNYEAAVVTLDAGYDGDSAGIGVTDVVRTWSTDGVNDEIQLETNTDLYQDMDLWGTLFELDKSDSDQTTARISYPDDQVIANVYAAEETATITSGSSGGGVKSVKDLGSVSVADTDVGSVSGKNLIVVGGSCVNSVAASLLGVSAQTCGADWTAATGVASGEYLIETFARTGDKVATLVAGTNAGDTTNGAKALTTQANIDTGVGKKYKGTSSTVIEAVMKEAA